MEKNDLVKLVLNMRLWQKTYFRTRDQGDLRICKDYERRVDAAVESLQDKGPELDFGEDLEIIADFTPPPSPN